MLTRKTRGCIIGFPRVLFYQRALLLANMLFKRLALQSLNSCWPGCSMQTYHSIYTSNVFHYMNYRFHFQKVERCQTNKVMTFASSVQMVVSFSFVIPVRKVFTEVME